MPYLFLAVQLVFSVLLLAGALMIGTFTFIAVMFLIAVGLLIQGLRGKIRLNVEKPQNPPTMEVDPNVRVIDVDYVEVEEQPEEEEKEKPENKNEKGKYDLW